MGEDRAKVTAFEVDPEGRRIFLGFKDGKVVKRLFFIILDIYNILFIINILGQNNFIFLQSSY